MRRLVAGLMLVAALVAGCGRNAADPYVTVSPDHPDAVCAPAGPRPSSLSCYLGEPGANPHRGRTNLGDEAVTIAVIPLGTATVPCPPSTTPPSDVCILNPSGVPVRAMFTTSPTTPQAGTPLSRLCPSPYVPGYTCSVEDGKLVVSVAGG